MHSKVIIASLVCLLAAGFGNLNAINNVKLSSDKTNTTYNCAPNAEGYDISFQKDYGVVGELFRATIVFDEEHSNFGIIDQSPLLAVSYRIIRNRALVTGTAPRDSGSYYAKFGYTVGTKQIVLASRSIMSANVIGNYCSDQCILDTHLKMVTMILPSRMDQLLEVLMAKI